MTAKSNHISPRTNLNAPTTKTECGDGSEGPDNNESVSSKELINDERLKCLRSFIESASYNEDKVLTHVHLALESAWQAGRILSDVKSNCKHGEWMPWLEKNLPEISYSTANRYIALATKFPTLENLKTKKDLTEAYRTAGVNLGYKDGKLESVPLDASQEPSTVVEFPASQEPNEGCKDNKPMTDKLLSQIHRLETTWNKLLTKEPEISQEELEEIADRILEFYNFVRSNPVNATEASNDHASGNGNIGKKKGSKTQSDKGDHSSKGTSKKQIHQSSVAKNKTSAKTT